MRETSVILRRELKSYFLSPIAYVVGILFLGVQIRFSASSILEHGRRAGMEPFFGLLPLVILIFVPALTMRLWAEERKLGTLELLMTFPVKASQLVAGKFLAALIYLGVLLLFTLGLPLTLAMFGDLDWGPVFAGYVGALLMSAAYLSVGMFFSSLTRDQIVALLLALVTLLFLYFLGHPWVLGLAEDVLPRFVVDAIGAISPNQYFSSIARGVLDTRDLIYYAAFSGFFLYANALVLRVRRHKG